MSARITNKAQDEAKRDNSRKAAQKNKKQSGATWITYSPNAEAKKRIKAAVEDGAGIDHWLDTLMEYEHITVSIKFSAREQAWKATLHEDSKRFNAGVYLCGYHSTASVALAVVLYALIEIYVEFPSGNEVVRADYQW